ncbi:restriction endonuclease subunit S [Agrococcus beijingensis]|uniref:restriction endonuclease subunit S n=1 Tax=Agrococcus beijingensis TaxID=3068634 RepID=UPI0027428C65|nr:restriction endonuclease subunit S [Agrococcus sp. REN33]
MREGWAPTALGDVLSQASDPFQVDRAAEYVNLGVRWYGEGVFARESKRGADIKGSRLYRVRAGQFTYNRLFAGMGSFGLVRDQHSDGVVSNEFPLFDVDDRRLVPAYLDLFFQQPSVWARVTEQSTGTTKSRLRWKEHQLLAFQLPLPPLAEQRRIVDLIGAVDDAIEKAEASAAAAGDVYRSLADRLFRSPPASRLGDLAETVPGANWSKADEAGSAEDGYEEVVGIGVTGAAGLDFSKMKYVAGLPAGVHRLRKSDLLVVRTNGNAERIGNVYSAEALEGRPFSAFHLGLRPKSEANAALIFHALSSPAAQRALTGMTSGSTGLKNLAAKKLLELQVPSTTDESFLESLEVASSTVRQHLTGIATLRDLRAKALPALLSGEHAVPDEYDEVMEVAA